MEISFSPSPVYTPAGREYAHAEGLAAISQHDLQWYFFLGQLSISHAGIGIGPPWGWVPLFDAMFCVRNVMAVARTGSGTWTIDFTENAELIVFDFDRGSLRVTPTYLDTVVHCSADEFVAAGTGFITGELRRVLAEYPSLARNQAARTLARDVGLELPAG
ncbi:hypothetical protein [Amycolatopsis sp. Poz14]|uniref:hypothetical protein n=1 Tax=Amycolatopsis sp. Poz14 TaxID=1447705 RepID=UPI001EE96ACB|nr:hypothetical protein [Amycolatopsis sp. Poz14]